MKGSFTVQERLDREAEVMAMLEAGKTRVEMAASLGISRQAMYKFLDIRGWKAQPSRSKSRVDTP